MNFDIKTRQAVGRSLAMILFAWAAPWLNADSLTQVTLDTSSLAGKSENLVLDFSSGGGTQSNTFSLSNFFSDGTLTNIQAHNAGVTGYLPGDVTFTNTNVVQELAVTIVLGDTISFDYTTTNNGPTAGAFSDEFDVYLLDPGTSQTVIASSDPSGAGSLLAIDLNGGLTPTITDFSSNGALTVGPPTSPAATAEPAGLLALGLALLLLGSRAGSARLLNYLRHGRSLGPIAALLLVLACVPALDAQSLTGVGTDSNIGLSFSGIRFNHANNTYVSVATITNTSGSDISGPFYVAITHITTTGVVTVANASVDMPDGSPAVTLTTPTALSPGQSATVPVAFSVFNSQSKFSVQGAVWDAASAPPVATLECPQDVFFGGTPTQLTYTVPTDSLGRVAACTPASGGDVSAVTRVTVQCSTTGAGSPAASCSTYPYVLLTSVPVTILPAPTTLGIIPCSSLAGSFSPSEAATLQNAAEANYPCLSVDAPGTAQFSIYNYGPYPAKNFSVTMKFPPGPSQAAWRFSQADSCTAVPQTFTIDFYGVVEIEPNGETVTCTFAELDSYQAFDAVLGLDVPSGGATTSVPAVEVDVAFDPTQNVAVPGTGGDMAARISMSAGFQPVAVPASISSRNQGCDYSSSPGFAILLNTCGVPPIVNTILVDTFAAAVTVVTGGAALFLDIPEYSSYIFNSGVAGVISFR